MGEAEIEVIEIRDKIAKRLKDAYFNVQSITRDDNNPSLFWVLFTNWRDKHRLRQLVSNYGAKNAVKGLVINGELSPLGHGITLKEETIHDHVRDVWLKVDKQNHDLVRLYKKCDEVSSELTEGYEDNLDAIYANIAEACRVLAIATERLQVVKAETESEGRDE